MDYDRKLYRRGWGEGTQCEVNVHGGTTIAKGDLLFLDRVDGLRNRGTSSKDYYAYPFSDISGTTLTLASRRTLASENFVGVAAWHSDGGVTENLVIHTSGLFKYPLKNSRHLKIGKNIEPAGSGVTLHNQKVSTSNSASSDHIGLVANSGTFQSSVEMNIFTLFFGNTSLIAG